MTYEHSCATGRHSHGLPEDPRRTFRESGYPERITAERRERNVVVVTTYA